MGVFGTGNQQLDDLLKDGGIFIPDNPTGISVLLKGPAGAGKTTLALLLAAKCAKDGGPSLYCALEQSADSLRGLCLSLNVDTRGWDWLDEKSERQEKYRGAGFIYLSNLQTTKKRERDFEDYLELLTEQTENYIDTIGTHKISLIVIDSLNVFGSDEINRDR